MQFGQCPNIHGFFWVGLPFEFRSSTLSCIFLSLSPLLIILFVIIHLTASLSVIPSSGNLCLSTNYSSYYLQSHFISLANSGLCIEFAQLSRASLNHHHLQSWKPMLTLLAITKINLPPFHIIISSPESALSSSAMKGIITCTTSCNQH